jgi:HlyD family secretion protein
VERQARTVEIEAEIDDPDKSALLPGYSADVEVLLAREDDVLRVPTSVIVNGNEVFAYDEENGRLVLRTIETGVANWDYTQGVSGLSEGELLVSSVDREGVADGALAQPE